MKKARNKLYSLLVELGCQNAFNELTANQAEWFLREIWKLDQ
jgi:hypothetical protein